MNRLEAAITTWLPEEGLFKDLHKYPQVSIMLRYLCVKFQRLTSFGWQDILIYIKVGDPRTKKLIVLGILILSIQNCVDIFVLCLGILV